MKNRNRTLLLGLAILTTGLGMPVGAANNPQATPLQVEDNASKDNKFNGKIEVVDTKENTLTVAGKLIHVSAIKTKIMRDGKNIQLADLKVGDQVYGTTRTTTDGKTEAVLVKTGEPPQNPPKE